MSREDALGDRPDKKSLDIGSKNHVKQQDSKNPTLAATKPI